MRIIHDIRSKSIRKETFFTHKLEKINSGQFK